jgi:hypothetical protein
LGIPNSTQNIIEEIAALLPKKQDPPQAQTVAV